MPRTNPALTPLDKADPTASGVDDVIPTSALNAQCPGGGHQADAPDEDEPLSAGERLGLALLRAQGWLGWGLIGGALLAWLAYGRTDWGLALLGGALVLSGLPPTLLGYYRGAFGVIEGWKARARGLLSVALGVGALLRALLT